MLEALKDWERTFYQAGGGNAALSFVAFGPYDQPVEISMGAYYTAGVPDFVDVTVRRRRDDPERFKTYLQGYAADWLRANDAAQFSTVRLCEFVIEVTGSVPDPKNLNYLRDVIGIIAALMDRRGIAVLDRTSLRWWRPGEWKEQVWSSHALNVPALVNTIVARESGGAVWNVSSRGMRKFGRPDIRLREVPERNGATAVQIVNRMASMLALGAVIPDGKALKTPLVKGSLVCRLAGGFDDPTFHNEIIDIEYPADRQSEP